MKICKVEITKAMDGNLCTNIYPVGYNAKKINIIAYDEKPLNKGDNIGYCIGCVADDFVFTDKMVEINKSKANAFIDARANVENNVDHKTKFATIRKQIIIDAGIV